MSKSGINLVRCGVWSAQDFHACLLRHLLVLNSSIAQITFLTASNYKFLGSTQTLILKHYKQYPNIQCSTTTIFFSAIVL